MKITLLGTGSPYPSLRRASSGYLLEIGQEKIIVDLGPGAFRNFLETGVELSFVTHFFLSHLHFDHCQGFLRLFHHRWDRLRDSVPPLNLYGPPGFQKFMDLQFGPSGAFAPDILSRIEHPLQKALWLQKTGSDTIPWPDTTVVELTAGQEVEGNNWTCMVEAVPHYEPFIVNHGFRFEAAGRVFAYSSDVAVKYTTKEQDMCLSGLRRLAKDADILVHYLNGVAIVSEDPDSPPAGIRPSLVGEIAQKAGVKTLVTTHHGPSFDSEPARGRALEEMRTAFGGETIWGEDLMEFEI